MNAKCINLQAMSEWSEELAARFGATIKERRKILGITAVELSARTKALGHTVSRSAIADFELGRRKDRVMIGDALVLAECLRIPLGYMLFPQQPDGVVEVAPGITARSYDAAQTMSGNDWIDTGNDIGESDDALVGNTERGGELVSGYQLPMAVKSLEELRKSAETNEVPPAIMRAYEDLVRAYGGVVHNG